MATFTVFGMFRVCRHHFSTMINAFQNKTLSRRANWIYSAKRNFFTERFVNSDRQRIMPSRHSLPYVFGFMGVSRALLGLGKREEEDPVVTLFREARMAQILKNFTQAEQLFHDALKVVDDQKKKNTIDESEYLHAKTNIYDSMADMALSQGHFDVAERLYKETMKCCLQIGKVQEHNSLIELSIKLASIYAMMKKDSDAVQGFEYCINAQEKKIKENPDSDKDTLALLGLALETYGRYLMYNKKLEQARPLFQRAFEIASTTLGNDHVQTLILRNDLASLDIMKKDYVQAEQNLRESIEIGERVNCPETPAFYCNLGAIYLRQSDVDGAEKVCEHAFFTAKKIGNLSAVSQAKQCLDKCKELRKRLARQ